MKIQTDFVMSINGETVTTEQTQPVFNPATRSVFAQVPDASQEQLDQTVDAAHRALKTWSATPADERQAALEAYADLIESHAEELMSLLPAEQGRASRRDPGHASGCGWRHCSLELSHPAGYLEDRTGSDVWLLHDPQAVSVYAAL